MRAIQLPVAILSGLLLAGQDGIGEKLASGNPEPSASAPLPRVTLVGTDFPDYQEVVGHLYLLGVSEPGALARTDEQFLRLSLVDVEQVSFLPDGLTVYQTLSTGAEMPLNLNFVVDGQRHAACFNPEVPYCTDFSLLNGWLSEAGLKVEDQKTAADLARFIVGLGISTVHHPRDFLFLRLSQSFGVEHYHYMKGIDEIYYEYQAPHRTEAKRKEHETITARYRDVVQPARFEETEQGFRMHAFTYKIMRAAGDLREWDILVHRNGQVDVSIKTLETGVGELFWSWAP